MTLSVHHLPAYRRMRHYVTNLPGDTTDAELLALFASFGEVTAAGGIECRAVPPDRVGLAAITLEPQAAHAAAALMNGMVLRDQVVSVKVVVPWNT
jgi:RNA recognition motif-containing protein